MSPIPYHVAPIVYDPRLGIKPQHPPSPPPNTGRERYPERYIFLLLAILLFIRFVKVLRKQRQMQESQMNAEYESLEAGFNSLEEETNEMPRVTVTHILLPSEIAQLSQRPMDDPYYMASQSRHSVSQLPAYDQIGTSPAQCNNESHKSALPQLVETDLQDRPPPYIDATTENSSG
ncbi:hypothetical protein CVT24_007386 [Panaeolus cyanescens]|uniref:Uncharacterized protein n=1 Tax=Panaeolus cyanescens TaxID=181874 RepID=A0A409YL33_9AGAR|nr:hypothetical protein CVT24_007386 [Panaeolus cyanescens]